MLKKCCLFLTDQFYLTGLRSTFLLVKKQNIAFISKPSFYNFITIYRLRKIEIAFCNMPSEL